MIKMKIIWEATDAPIKRKYEERKDHFLKNIYLKKPKEISSDEAFLAAMLSSYLALWMNSERRD